MQFEAACKFIFDKLKQELPAHLSYHGIHHIMDVYESAKNIGELENISKYDMYLLLTASLFHDSGFLVGNEKHEEQSCVFARAYLPGYEYNEQEIDIICGMIMATRLPQNPQNHLEQIICDADLDYLGRDDFFSTGEKLFAEFKLFGVVKNETDWNKLQVRFLENHAYFTPTAIKLRQAKKQEHLDILRLKIAE